MGRETKVVRDVRYRSGHSYGCFGSVSSGGRDRSASSDGRLRSGVTGERYRPSVSLVPVRVGNPAASTASSTPSTS